MASLAPNPTLRPRLLRTTLLGAKRATCVGLGAVRAPGPEAPRAIATGLALGATVLDTAPHYHRGAHERAVGQGLRLAEAAGACERDAVVVCTKVGYVPELVDHTRTTLGFARLRALVERSYVAPGLFAWDELAHADHTFAPAFVRASVARSLQAIGVAALDCVFLDAPELQASATSPAGFVRRVAGAFAALEALCAVGRVHGYGISTGADLDPATFVALARGVAGQGHHLRAVRAPLARGRADAPGAQVLARAAALGLYTVAAGCVGGAADAIAHLRWACTAPFVGTALFGSRDARHVRANLAAAAAPRHDAPAQCAAG